MEEWEVEAEGMLKSGFEELLLEEYVVPVGGLRVSDEERERRRGSRGTYTRLGWRCYCCDSDAGEVAW